MDNQHLTRYFPIHPQQDEEILDAQQQLRESAHQLADTLNRLLPESQTKVEILMRLMHIVRDVDLALTLDGPSRARSMVVMPN